ncbi:O-acyltransferase WSD1-like [Ipomoea triloba]|uniref:O-acyltransferase WSD1-like n=1 Tax=Ipomoea triloba TaxID=35885 RepID=UPI00125E6147|nr:O-acyltransferase WSD1-like [Ipomoea triloba]
MEHGYEEAASPSAQFLNSSVLSLTILGVLESEIPIQASDSLVISLLKDVFVPINPRFSSIMVSEGTDGRVKKWKRVEVNHSDHVKVPNFPAGKPIEFYDDCLSDYLSKMAMEAFPPNRPLWEIHLFKYPTTNAAGNLIFKLHHSLGDGYSLMGAILSCLQRADNPALPLTFPSRQRSAAAAAPRSKASKKICGFFKAMPRVLFGAFNTVYDFGWSVLKSTLVEDDRTPVRSGDHGVEFRPIATTTMSFSLDQIKQIKDKLEVTINDVVTGIIIYGTRLYMKQIEEESSKARCTALVLFNTRAIGGYKSVTEMIKPNAEMPWGNHFTFLPVSLPALTPATASDPLRFVRKAHRIIKRKRNSASVYLTGWLLQALMKTRGSEATARYIHGTSKNSSMGISNMIGPMERMSLANHPAKGIYFIIAGIPQSLCVTMVSYVGSLRIALSVEKDFIDAEKFKCCVDHAFEEISKAALGSS